MTAALSRWWALVPRDTVLVRDGRTFEAGGGRRNTDRAHPVMPWPSTVAGAVGAALSSATPIEPQLVRGPVLAQRGTRSWLPHFSTPADVVIRAATQPGPRAVATRLNLREADQTRTDLGGEVSGLLLPADGHSVEPAGGLLSRDGLGRYLGGDPPPHQGLHLWGWKPPADTPLVGEPRIGLAREGRTARSGFLYASTHLRPKDGWGFLVECVDSSDSAGVAPALFAPLGARARLADLEPASDVAWPERPDDFPDGHLLLYVATPALWPNGWRPPLPPAAKVVAAAVLDPVVVATASPRQAATIRQPVRATAALRWAVPPGSVYWLRFEVDPDAADLDPAERAKVWADTVHGTALGPALNSGPQASGAVDRTQTAGFGVVLTGRWPSPAETQDEMDESGKALVIDREEHT